MMAHITIFLTLVVALLQLGLVSSAPTPSPTPSPRPSPYIGVFVAKATGAGVSPPSITRTTGASTIYMYSNTSALATFQLSKAIDVYAVTLWTPLRNGIVLSYFFNATTNMTTLPMTGTFKGSWVSHHSDLNHMHACIRTS